MNDTEHELGQALDRCLDTSTIPVVRGKPDSPAVALQAECVSRMRCAVLLGQTFSSDAPFTPKVSTLTTLSHSTMPMRICKNLAVHQ